MIIFNLRLPLVAAVVVFSFLFSTSSFANSKIDSLYQIVQETSNDSLKMIAFLDFLFDVNDEYHPDLEIYADELLDYAQKQNNVKGVAFAYRYKGYAKKNEDNYPEAVKNLKISLKKFLAINDFEQACEVQKSIVINTNRLNDFALLENEFEKYEKLVEEVGDNFALGNFYLMKAEKVNKNGDLIEMEELTTKAIEMYASYGDKYKFNIAICFANMANSLMAEKPMVSIEYLDKAKAIAEKNKVPGFLGYVIGLQGLAAQTVGDYEKAIAFAFEEIALFDSLQFKSQMAEARIALGNLHMDFNEMEKAENAYQEAIELSKKSSFYRGLIQGNSYMGKLFLLQKDYKKAILFYKKSNLLADSVQENQLKLENQANLATAYIKLGQLREGNEILLKALKENNHEHQSVDQDIFFGLANYFFIKENWAKAIDYAQQSYQVSEINKNSLLISQITLILYQANKKLKQYPTALKWLEIQKGADATVLNESNIRNLTTAKLNADFNKEKQDIAAKQEKQEILLEAKAERNLLAAGGIGGIALLAFGFFFNARRNNKKIAAQKKQLEQLNQTKDHIFAIIGHDLRKPVVAFNGISETINYLIKKEDYSTLQQLGTEIEKDGFALQKLTDNLLNWALMQRDVIPYNPQKINLPEKAEEVALIFEKIARDKNIELVNAVPEGLKVFADPNALLTILINLTDNALKYTPAGGRVEIGAVNDSKGIRIQITDTGVGMSVEHIRNIFLLQRDKSQKGTRGEKGTGLGLHLVNELVKLNRGVIEAESNEGEGTTFRVLLPQAA